MLGLFRRCQAYTSPRPAEAALAAASAAAAVPTTTTVAKARPRARSEQERSERRHRAVAVAVPFPAPPPDAPGYFQPSPEGPSGTGPTAALATAGSWWRRPSADPDVVIETSTGLVFTAHGAVLAARR